MSTPRDRMILAAMKLFQREGYAATSWRKLVQESGAPWGSAHHYFPDGKEQLGVAALEIATAGVAAFFEQCFTADRSAADGAQKLFEASAEQLERSGYCDGCPIATIALETASTSPVLAAVCQASFAQWRGEIEAGLMRRGIAETRAGALATTMFSLFEGGLVVARVTRSTAPLHNAAAAMRVLLEGEDAYSHQR